MEESKKQEIILHYNWDTTFDKNEELFISTLSWQKEIVRKLTNKMVAKLINEMLNNEVTSDFVSWYKEAIRQFNNLIK